MWRELVVELIENHPCAHPHRSALRIEIRDATAVAGEIDHQSAAEGATCETGAGAPRGDLDAALGSLPQEIGRLNRRAWKGDRRRLDTVDRGVDSIEIAGEHIGAHLAAGSLQRFQLRLLQFCHPVILSALGAGCRMQDANGKSACPFTIHQLKDSIDIPADHAD